MFRLGYNTNGLAHHRPLDALRLVSELGYEALAITPDPGCLDPWNLGSDELSDMLHWSSDLGVDLVVETGSRYLLDAERKHFPSLLEADASDRARRLDFLKRCVEIADAIDAPVVSIWSGSLHGAPPTDPVSNPAQTEVLWDRLASGVRELLAFAEDFAVKVAFEPEPGMFVEDLLGYQELLRRLGDPPQNFGLTLDLGHCLVNGEDVVASIHAFSDQLINVHLDDIANREHTHRMFGEGELDLRAALRALADVDYRGVASVELSRDSHCGAVAARTAMNHLRTALGMPI